MSISGRSTKLSGGTWKIEMDFVKRIPQPKYTRAAEKELIIERVWGGKREVITFNTAYSELSTWLNKSFSNCSEMGFSDCLFELLTSGAEIHTPKADYRLWSPRKFAAAVTEARSNKSGVAVEKCGCKYNWNDKFTEHFCDVHFKVNAEIEDEDAARIAAGGQSS